MQVTSQMHHLLKHVAKTYGVYIVTEENVMHSVLNIFFALLLG